MPLILAILALAVISLSVIFSATKQLATNQLIFWVIGLALFFAIYKQRLQIGAKFTLAAYLATLASLIAVFFTGEEIRGATRWIDLPIFRFQPSEIAKLTTIITLAHIYSKKGAVELSNVIKSLVIIAPLFLLVLFEPDIGSALSIAAIFAGMTYVAKISLRTTLVFAAIGIVILPLIFNFLAPYQKQRILSFLNPGQDPLGAGYNIIQSKIAIGSGQLFGRGLGRGSQSQLNFLPEAQSDFVFASLVEELGFVGGATVVLILAFILLRIHKGIENYDNYKKLVTAGTLSLLTYQTTVNIGMNLGLIPVTGITLPMISYGGSSLITTLVLLGIVSSYKR